MSNWALITIGMIIGANIGLVLSAILTSGGQSDGKRDEDA